MRALVLAASLSFLAGCGVIYKVDVYQGNLLRATDIEQLKTGLNKRQVIALLGTPSVADPFHQSRWDYLATVSQRGSKTEVKNLVLKFEGEQLVSIEGDYFPENDVELVREMRRYGNLPREERNRRRAGRS
ncbi:outer membrane protein assembly factor BamE [Pseudomarimonas salicorniae]|uniref:Outer membrane protein assembly factor BamE n=1 Tax=Pseudomarimonas salicorniae TaxID=2933270 RepID=A0ABT0GEZ5_9GAMM|nr:outer membrane protein assembly factor BamE [Lysobacter sp. CAU 1642]MCK7593121.1 outer membrane protein assembly factor BamE [Lysobacter sp. CAU 1642]